MDLPKTAWMILLFCRTVCGGRSELTCKSLGLLCPGAHPTEHNFTWSGAKFYNAGDRFPPAAWQKRGSVNPQLTSEVTCQEYALGATGFLLIRSSGVPNHVIGKFPLRRKPGPNRTSEIVNPTITVSIERKQFL